MSNKADRERTPADESGPASPPTRRSALLSAARHDWATASIRGRLMLIAAVAALTYEWSSGNETFCALLAGVCLGHDPTAVRVGIAGAVVGAVVAIQQIASGSLLIAGVRHLTQLFEVLTGIVQGKFTGRVPTYRSLRIIARIPISFLMGASFVVTQDAIAGEPRPRRAVLLSAATTGATVFMLVGVFGGAVVAARGTAMQRPATITLEIVSDWRVWAAIVFVPLVLRWSARRIRQRRSTPIG